MEKEIIAPLEKKIIIKYKNLNVSSECCGGTPANNVDACCKLDEDKKSVGKEDCGCNTVANFKSKTSCC